jgi:subtilase family serine protease
MLFPLVILFITTTISKATDRHILWDASSAIPSTWKQTTRATANDIVTFHVALKHNNENIIYEELRQVSDPYNKKYGQYLTSDDLKRKFSAPKSVQNRVESFLNKASGNIFCSNLGSSFSCKTSAPVVEKLFKTQMYHFTREEVDIVRHVNTISIPIHLKNAIEFVSGLGQFMYFETGKKSKAIGIITQSTTATNCGNNGAECYILPETIRTLYNISESLSLGSSKTSVGVAEFRGNYNIADADLKLFGAQTGSRTNPLIVNARGGQPNDSSQPVSVEANLDIQYTSGLGDGVKNWVWNQEHWMYALCQDLQNASSRPSVISMSYAWSESAQCSSTTDADCSSLGVNASVYVARTNQEFAKLGLLGITMLSASGDSGCHGRTEGLCFLQKSMKPDYPASSPYVTSVGGTMLHQGTTNSAKSPICQIGQPLNGKCATGGVEVVSDTGSAGGRISSGGGFAAYSDIPNYQKAFVQKYLNNTEAMSFAGGKGVLFNVNGRGYPDISALAHQIYIVMNGETSSVDGTSAASPTIAGLVGLINSARIQQGKPTVGFLNPLLYAAWTSTNGAAFNDITIGNNACTEQGCFCKTGFQATSGWDASSGLGTPNLGKLMAAINEMDKERYNNNVKPS